MRLAVFTSMFPARVSTFFACDVRALLAEGIEIDVYAIYNLDPRLWRYVPEILGEKALPRDRVHHVGFARSLLGLRPWPGPQFGRWLADAAAVGLSALRFGVMPLVKSLYVFPKAWAWAQPRPQYDHVLAYWGNYAATCARAFHRLLGRDVPFSTFLQAGTDLYRTQVYLPQKLLYADRIFVTCEFSRAFLREKYPDIFPRIAEKIHLHHLSLNLAELPFQPEGRMPNRVLGVGRLDRNKGFDYLLRAAAELVRRGSDVQVQLIGGGEEERALRQLAQQLGIRERVDFAGWQPFAAVQAAMTQATVLVHASPHIGDAVPTVIKEAQALGLPVVGTTVAGIPELLDQGRTGILVPPRDATALADGVGRLLADEGLRRQYAVAARGHAEKTYNMWDNGRRLAALLRGTTRAAPKH